MVGGKIIGLVRGPENTLVHVENRHDTCSVRVVERRKDNGEGVRLRIGDSIWWQMDTALWTPAGIKAVGEGCRKTWDIHLLKVVYAH